MRESHGHPRVPMQSADEPGQGHENIQQRVSLADPLLHPFLKRCLEVIEKRSKVGAFELGMDWDGLHAVAIPWILRSSGLGSVGSRASHVLKHDVFM